MTPVPLTREAAHLDTVLCLVRPGLGIRCRKCLPTGVPTSLRSWEWIDVTRKQALEHLSPDTG